MPARRENVLEPGTGYVHAVPDSLSGNVTLCGHTDWLLDQESGRSTEKPVDCAACLAIIEHCHDAYERSGALRRSEKPRKKRP